MNCVAIDDEAMALRVLENYIAKVPSLNLLQVFTDALQGMDFLNKNQVDLLFLDINMPDISGVQLLRTLKQAPPVIFTTAYAHYAVESYEYEAVDYLLKPIDFERFLKAINKADTRLGQKTSIPATPATSIPESIMVKSGTSLVKIKLNELLYIEGMGNYIVFVLPNEKIMSLITMNEVLEILPAPLFSRVHKSFIVSHDKVRSIDRNSVKVPGREIPLSATFRDAFLEKLKLK